ncbi:hypothetical protein BSLG_005931 [Batrachochytrium salamandrivorans]|nr:hypothetical protein BSLG_005931 [Batrachochytrium salamandrivorans]
MLSAKTLSFRSTYQSNSSLWIPLVSMSDDEEDDEFLPVEGHHTDTVDRTMDDPEEHHADIPVQGDYRSGHDCHPYAAKSFTQGKSINNTIQDSILAQTFESEDDADDDYDCGTEGAEDENEAQDNIAHFELATSCATDTVTTLPKYFVMERNFTSRRHGLSILKN